MTAISYRATRIAWLWCIAYTAVAPRESRERRRGEIRSHLWESEHSHLSGAAVVLAAARGALHDVGWVAARGLPALGRSFGTPTPYVALAPAFPIQAWIVSSVTTSAVAHPFEGLGAFGGGVMLVAAGLVWVIRKVSS